MRIFNPHVAHGEGVKYPSSGVGLSSFMTSWIRNRHSERKTWRCKPIVERICQHNLESSWLNHFREKRYILFCLVAEVDVAQLDHASLFTGRPITQSLHALRPALHIVGLYIRDVKASRSTRPRGQIIWPRSHNGWPRPHSVVASASKSGLVMKPNRARMSDASLEELVFLKCNDCVTVKQLSDSDVT